MQNDFRKKMFTVLQQMKADADFPKTREFEHEYARHRLLLNFKQTEDVTSKYL